MITSYPPILAPAMERIAMLEEEVRLLKSQLEKECKERIAMLEEFNHIKYQQEEACKMLGLTDSTITPPTSEPRPVTASEPTSGHASEPASDPVSKTTSGHASDPASDAVYKPSPNPNMEHGIKYCSCPEQEGEKVYFPHANLSDNEMDMAYRLEINGKEAKFYLLSGEIPFGMLTSDTNAYIDALADVEYGDDFSDIETLVPGKVVLSDSRWKVVEKAKVKIK